MALRNVVGVEEVVVNGSGVHSVKKGLAALGQNADRVERVIVRGASGATMVAFLEGLLQLFYYSPNGDLALRSIQFEECNPRLAYIDGHEVEKLNELMAHILWKVKHLNKKDRIAKFTGDSIFKMKFGPNVARFAPIYGQELSKLLVPKGQLIAAKEEMFQAVHPEESKLAKEQAELAHLRFESAPGASALQHKLL